MALSIVEIQFAPSLPYVLWLKKGVLLEVHENYNKHSFRNKCLLKSNHGSQSFIIPLQKGKNNKTPIQLVKIAYDEDWMRSIRHKLQTEYGKTPYFIHYIDEFCDLINQKHDTLFELNWAILSFYMEHFQINSPEFSQQYDRYPSSRDYRDLYTPKSIKQYPILLQEQEFEYFKFIPGHSAIEILFQYGPEAAQLLELLTLSNTFDFLLEC